jgi:hypothetical protein
MKENRQEGRIIVKMSIYAYAENVFVFQQTAIMFVLLFLKSPAYPIHPNRRLILCLYFF